ncbi:dienelactone hydrolase family protein [Oceanibium sediminis]|uniref:dienelactone hydrolase family protein n=1 Tax=Oceanibium sediminis TaxID=2026339 RepID=UPI000DD3499C|nr:dienelactone hydrolase family protein [Oceanibium sediminis]
MAGLDRIDIPAADGALPALRGRPPGGSTGRAIVLLQEIFGLNLHIREVVAQWALLGFDVIAPDLFWRIEPGLELGYDGADLARARDVYAKLDWAAAEDDVQRTAEWLRADGARTVAVLGYCFGGKLAVRVAARGIVDRAVGYYGVGIEKLGIAGQVTCPTLLHFGAEDPGTPPEAIATLRRQMPEGTTIHVYENAGHGFNNWYKPSHNAPAGQLAFARSAAFLSADDLTPGTAP